MWWWIFCLSGLALESDLKLKLTETSNQRYEALFKVNSEEESDIFGSVGSVNAMNKYWNDSEQSQMDYKTPI